MKIANSIRKIDRNFKEKIFHSNSFFEVHFTDGSIRNEKDTNWSDVSEEKKIKCGDNIKTVRVCVYPTKKVVINHDDAIIEIVAKDDERIYQAIHAQISFFPDGEQYSKILGRIVGKIKDNEIIEEKYIDSIANEITGFKK